jgi:phosphatidylserine/phosphatidylglycerophosphate/cardiolipin synthase-like enzyme
MIMQLALLFSIASQAQMYFSPEEGSFDQDLTSIKQYYASYGISYLSFTGPAEREYKINERNQFQVRDYFTYEWFDLQKEIRLDVDRFNAHYKSSTFLEAKLSYYRQRPFMKNGYRHKHELRWMKEWGGLNHPPIQERISDLGKFSLRYGQAPKANDALFEPSFHHGIDSYTNSELSFGNALEILEDGKSYQKKLELIKNAKKSIYFSTVFYLCDESTDAVTKALIEKHQQKVKIRLITDNMADRQSDDSCLEKLEDAGILHVRADDFWKYEGRTIYHSKKLVVDDTIAIIGGQNMIAADNFSKGTDFMNRDLDLLVSGPMVTEVSMGFVEDWQHFYTKWRDGRWLSRRKAKLLPLDMKAELSGLRVTLSNQRANGLRGRDLYAAKLNDKQAREAGVCRFVQQSPYKDRLSIGKAFVKYLDRTTDYLGIIDPAKMDPVYDEDTRPGLKEKWDSFAMYNQLHKRVLGLAQNGAEVDFITSSYDMAGNEAIATNYALIKSALKRSDFASAQSALSSIDTFNKDLGVPAFTNLLNDFAPVSRLTVWNNIGYEHSKVFYFDRLWASIGSYNFQHNATDHSYENTAICSDKALKEQLDEIFVRDMANSMPLVFRK